MTIQWPDDGTGHTENTQESLGWMPMWGMQPGFSRLANSKERRVSTTSCLERPQQGAFGHV